MELLSRNSLDPDICRLDCGAFVFAYGAVLPVWVGFGSVVASTLVVVRKGLADAKDVSVGFFN